MLYSLVNLRFHFYIISHVSLFHKSTTCPCDLPEMCPLAYKECKYWPHELELFFLPLDPVYLVQNDDGENRSVFRLPCYQSVIYLWLSSRPTMSVLVSHTVLLVGIWRETKASPPNGNFQFQPRQEKEI